MPCSVRATAPRSQKPPWQLSFSERSATAQTPLWTPLPGKFHGAAHTVTHSCSPRYKVWMATQVELDIPIAH